MLTSFLAGCAKRDHIVASNGCGSHAMDRVGYFLVTPQAAASLTSSILIPHVMLRTALIVWNM